MARPEVPNQAQFILSFGAGRNTRASETLIDSRECADGENFGLDIENGLFFRRKPFDLSGTATNAGRINGAAQLIKADGSISTLIQAGTIVYEWDGGSTFTQRGTVASGARLRGHAHQNWILDDVVIITDLGLKENVLQWDGTTLSEMSHNLGGDFKAKYCVVENDRAWYANVTTSTATPHLMAVSKVTDYDNLNVGQRPASGVPVTDPFFLTAPDLKPINGFIPAFGTLAVSTRNGRMFRATGSNSTDLALAQLYADSAAVSDEAMTFIGNDIAYGRVGKVESLFSTETFGNVESDDLSRLVSNSMEDVTDWIAAYNPRFDKAYFFTPEFGEVHVLHRAFTDAPHGNTATDSTISPWSRWKTQHAMAFQPTAVWTMKRPADGLDAVFMGDNSGNIYQLDGSGAQDGGTADIKAERLSQVIRMPNVGPVYNFTGWVTHRKIFPATLTLNFEFGGSVLDDSTTTVTLDGATNVPVYGGGLYYSNQAYYSTPFKGRFTREQYNIAGKSEQFQVRATVEGATDFFIEEIGIDFSTE